MRLKLLEQGGFLRLTKILQNSTELKVLKFVSISSELKLSFKIYLLGLFI